MEKIKNDVFDLFEVEGGIAPEANLQLPDRELVADWKGYKSRSLYIFDDIDDRVMLYVKNIIQLSILRQMNSHVLDAFLANNEQFKYERYLYLQKLLEILEDA